MKNWISLKTIVVALSVVTLIFTTGCPGDLDDQSIPQPNNRFGTEGITVTPAGGIIQALDGNVTLNFPDDAVDQPIRFTVTMIMDKVNNGGNETGNVSSLALKAVLIEPYVVFNEPVQVSLRYDGCLCNGVIINDGMDLAVTMWKSEVAFLKDEIPCASTTCFVSSDQGTICTCICQSGLIAVQMQ